jgi:hypothetical protein
MICGSRGKFFRLLTLAFLACQSSRLAAQDFVLPPSPPGFANTVWQAPDGTWGNAITPDGSAGFSGGGGFTADDSSGPPGIISLTNGGSGGGFSGLSLPLLPDRGTNLWLFIEQVSNTVVVTLTNTHAGSNYLLLASTDVLGPWVAIQSLIASSNMVVANPINILPDENLFFIGEQAAAPPLLSIRWMTSLVSSNNSAPGYLGPNLQSSPAIGSSGAFPPLYITTGNSNIFCLDSLLGDVLWTNLPPDLPSMGDYPGSASIGPDGAVYAGDFAGNISAYDPSSGTLLWRSSTGSNSAIYSTPVVCANGQIIVTVAPPLGMAGSPSAGVMVL